MDQGQVPGNDLRNTRPLFVGELIDTYPDLDTDAELIEYGIVTAIPEGRQAQWHESLSVELRMLGRPDQLVEHHQRCSDELYGRARRTVHRAQFEAATAAGQRMGSCARRWGSVPRPCCRSRTTRSRRSGSRAGPSDDDDGGAAEQSETAPVLHSSLNVSGLDVVQEYMRALVEVCPHSGVPAAEAAADQLAVAPEVQGARQ